ncbi:MAG: hypothetical protein K2H14_08095 [Muribaculaceae bacterium]|nr:hypothetical protein [Muribaculaceae bacterium]
MTPCYPYKKRSISALLAIGFLLTAVAASAKKQPEKSDDPALTVVKTSTTTITEITYADGSVATRTSTDSVMSAGAAAGREKPARPGNSTPDPFGAEGTLNHFTWGVGLGSGVDLTAHDMTMFEISACFGYKNEWIRFAGIGAGIMSMMNNSSRCYPVYGMVRTSFSPYHRLCFLEAKAGASFSSFLSYGSQTNFYGSLGFGLTLAHSRKFTSHVVLRGVIMPLNSVTLTDGMKALDYTLAYAAIGLGCAF